MFRLLIECTKDIDSININFSDGTSVVTESKQNEDTETHYDPRDSIESFERRESKKECIKSVNIPDVTDRPPNVDETLNNFEV